jgi:benzoate/toluate 1,2-dioxygenase beta subunit
MSLERWHAVQQFLFREARLLDERRFEEWLGLYAPDAEYWVPYAWGQESPRDHVSLFYETVELLRMRVDRLTQEHAPLDSPPVRVNHHLSNVMVEEGDGGRLTASAYLIFSEYRRGETRWLSGRCTWTLREKGGGFEIVAKRVDLLDCDREDGHVRFAIPF